MTISTLDEFDFHERLAAVPGASLVLYGRPGCGACRHAAQLLALLPTGSVDQLYAVDVERATALAREYDVFHLPALFLFSGGRYHAKLDCELEISALQRAIRLACAAPAEEEP